MPRNLFFDLFRLNIVDIHDLLHLDQPTIRDDRDIIQVIKESSKKEHDKIQETKSSMYLWSLRNFNLFEDIEIGQAAFITLSKSLLQREGQIVTDSGIFYGTSESTPPLAQTTELIFFFERHLVASFLSTVNYSDVWIKYFREINTSASLRLNKRSFITLEPIPAPNEVVNSFKSFDKITKFKAKVRLPNPEFSRFTKKLYEELQDNSIREYLQEMYNPGGLNKSTQGRAFATAALANDGYKDGPVEIQGLKNGKITTEYIGKAAMRIGLDDHKDVVRKSLINKDSQSKFYLTLISNAINEKYPKD